MTKRVMRYGWAAMAVVLCVAAAPVQQQDGWVTILDAKSFKDWKVAPESPRRASRRPPPRSASSPAIRCATARWTFKDGVLHGEGGVSHIFSPRGDYENFVYRAEIKIKDKGNSGQYFRTAFGNGFPNGYEAQVNSTHTDPVRTGSLYGFVKVTDMLVPPDTWFTQEVTAVGNHIVIKVNGKTTVDYVDTKNTPHEGPLRLPAAQPRQRGVDPERAGEGATGEVARRFRRPAPRARAARRSIGRCHAARLDRGSPSPCTGTCRDHSAPRA